MLVYKELCFTHPARTIICRALHGQYGLLTHAISSCSNQSFMPFPNPLLLVWKLRLPNLITSQYHIQHSLHIPQHLLIRRRRPPLKVRHYRWSTHPRLAKCSCETTSSAIYLRCVALRRQVLLCHGCAFVVLRLRACSLNGIADFRADCLWFDNVV